MFITKYPDQFIVIYSNLSNLHYIPRLFPFTPSPCVVCLQQLQFYTSGGTAGSMIHPVVSAVTSAPATVTASEEPVKPSPQMQSLQARLQTLGFLSNSPSTTPAATPKPAAAATAAAVIAPEPQAAVAAVADPPDPPPPPPKKSKLPPKWKSAKDEEGKTYYYHTVTR
jgi:peptidoglycan hydrolase-like protein with peptidoglycan-binding domain